MPRIFRSALRVPHHELDPRGWLRFGSLARLLQVLAIDASADAGFDYDWYRANRTNWIVRRTTIEAAGAVPAGVPLEVETHVADFRRVRSVRNYAIRLPGEAAPRVRARTDWVYFDWRTLRPASVPAEMIAAFSTDGAEPPERRSELRLDPPGEAVHSSRRRVEHRDLDGLGHVNNAVWVDYVEEAVRLAARGGGLPADPPARPAFFDVLYLGEAREDQELDVLVWPGVGAAPDLRACCEIRDEAGEPLLRAVGRWSV